MPSCPFPVPTSTGTPYQASRTTKFKLGSTYERQHLSVWLWVTPLSVITPSFIYLPANFSFLCSWIIFHCVYVARFHYPFTSLWWTAKFLPFLGYSEWSSNNHRWAEISAVWYKVCWVYVRSGINGVEGGFISIVLETSRFNSKVFVPLSGHKRNIRVPFPP